MAGCLDRYRVAFQRYDAGHAFKLSLGAVQQVMLAVQLPISFQGLRKSARRVAPFDSRAGATFTGVSSGHSYQNVRPARSFPPKIAPVRNRDVFVYLLRQLTVNALYVPVHA